jgi:hypothetical protein
VSDRLPTPQDDVTTAKARGGERASATPAKAASPRRSTKAADSRVGKIPASLAEVQRWMVDAITGPNVRPSNIERVLKSGPRLGAEDRLEVYRSGYEARLLECLRDDYPVLAETVGEEHWVEIGRSYIRAHPSTNSNLNYFGRHMETLCRSVDVNITTPMRAFIVGLAALEWAMVEVLHAEMAPSFNLEKLSAIPIEAWAGVRFVANESVRLLNFDCPVNPYYQACRMGERPLELPPPMKSATVVYRRDLQIWRMDLTPAMTDVLSALLRGVPLGDALEQLTLDTSLPEAVAEAERSVMIWFREWVNGGLFSAATIGATAS